MLKLRYNGNEYPFVEFSEGGYEEIITLIPEPTGDYFLAKISSQGRYDLIDEVREQNVEIIKANCPKCNESEPVNHCENCGYNWVE